MLDELWIVGLRIVSNNLLVLSMASDPQVLMIVLSNTHQISLRSDNNVI